MNNNFVNELRKKNKNAVVYATNDGYAKIAGISLFSLIKNNYNLEFDIYILDDGISLNNKEKIVSMCDKYKRKVIFIDIKKDLHDLLERYLKGTIEEEQMTTYARFLLGLVLDDNIDRVIYLDCDTLVVGDISYLFKVDLQSNVVGMALDCLKSSYKTVIGLVKEEKYYNAGVMVMDMVAWKSEQCFERMVKHMTDVKNDYPLRDQDLINVVLGGKIFEISCQYNFQPIMFAYRYEGYSKVYNLNAQNWMTKEEFQKAREQIAILHFCGNTFGRIWLRNSKHPKKKEYDIYYNNSPWGEEKQEKKMWPIQYVFQFISFYFPKFVAESIGALMQYIFIYFKYQRK